MYSNTQSYMYMYMYMYVHVHVYYMYMYTWMYCIAIFAHFFASLHGKDWRAEVRPTNLEADALSHLLEQFRSFVQSSTHHVLVGDFNKHITWLNPAMEGREREREREREKLKVLNWSLGICPLLTFHLSLPMSQVRPSEWRHLQRCHHCYYEPFHSLSLDQDYAHRLLSMHCARAKDHQSTLITTYRKFIPVNIVYLLTQQTDLWPFAQEATVLFSLPSCKKKKKAGSPDQWDHD